MRQRPEQVDFLAVGCCQEAGCVWDWQAYQRRRQTRLRRRRKSAALLIGEEPRHPGKGLLAGRSKRLLSRYSRRLDFLDNPPDVAHRLPIIPLNMLVKNC